jgi:hypothetical protein
MGWKKQEKGAAKGLLKALVESDELDKRKYSKEEIRVY